MSLLYHCHTGRFVNIMHCQQVTAEYDVINHKSSEAYRCRMDSCGLRVLMLGAFSHVHLMYADLLQVYTTVMSGG